MSRRILLIDDDAAIRRLIRRILEREGYELAEMESAEGLERRVQEFAPDAVVCDLMMPGRDGIAVCKALRSGSDGPSLPVVLVTAKSFAGDRRAALDAGAWAYIVKPFAADELVRAVHTAVAGRLTVRIWGCRGSIPAPEWAPGRFGGNTSCLELLVPGEGRIILDAGSGIRALGNRMVGEAPMRTRLFLTHYHWDHIQGLPFFKPLYVPDNEFTIYGPADTGEDLEAILAGQMGGAFFPVAIDAFRSALKFVPLQEQEVACDGVGISTLYTFHPGRTLAYRITVGKHSIVYAPDNELLPEWTGAELAGEALRLARFASGASLLLHDCAYTRQEYDTHRGWGHSCGECLAAVAAAAGVEKLILFHHDPDHSDEAVEAVHAEFRAALEARGCDLPSEPAREGTTLEL